MRIRADKDFNLDKLVKTGVGLTTVGGTGILASRLITELGNSQIPPQIDGVFAAATFVGISSLMISANIAAGRIEQRLRGVDQTPSSINNLESQTIDLRPGIDYRIIE